MGWKVILYIYRYRISQDTFLIKICLSIKNNEFSLYVYIYTFTNICIYIYTHFPKQVPLIASPAASNEPDKKKKYIYIYIYIHIYLCEAWPQKMCFRSVDCTRWNSNRLIQGYTLYSCIYIYMYAWLYTCTYIYMCMYMYIFKCIRIDMCIYIYTYTYWKKQI